MLILICIYILFIILDLIPLIKQKNYKEAFIFIIFFVTSLFLGIATIKGVTIPSVDEALEDLLEKLHIGYK
jgi:hypothetical protein